MQEKALGMFALPVPFVLSRECPDSISGCFRIAVFLNQPCGAISAHFSIDRSRVFATLPERLKEALAHRRDADVKFAHTIIDDGRTDGRMFRRFVLNDLQCTNASALLAARADEKA